MSYFKIDWSNLPEHILVHIFSYVEIKERVTVAKICQNWNSAFRSPYLWSHFNFWFYTPRQSAAVKFVDIYGHALRSVTIELDQSVELNRLNAIDVICRLSNLKKRRLKSLNIQFVGANPLLYGGREFVDALTKLFGKADDSCTVINHLEKIDLSGTCINIPNVLIDTLSNNNSKLTYLNIQNGGMISTVTSLSILNLVKHCRQLEQLKVHNYSLSDDVLLALIDSNKNHLKKLSIRCRREEKYGVDISDEIWQALAKKFPALRVCLKFDSTCPLYRVSSIMRPSMPVDILTFETYTYIYDELRQAGNHYCKSLEKLVLKTPLSRNSPELNAALLSTASKCKDLNQIYVHCRIEKETIETILKLHPLMKDKGTYLLKYD